jgi:hypothetical protein
MKVMSGQPEGPGAITRGGAVQAARYKLTAEFLDDQRHIDAQLLMRTRKTAIPAAFSDCSVRITGGRATSGAGRLTQPTGCHSMAINRLLLAGGRHGFS